MASEIFTAPPSQSISKKKHSSAAVRESYQKKVSQKALAVVPTLPQKQFDYVGNVYKHEDNFADEGARRVDNQKWDTWARDNPKDLVSMEEYAVGQDWRGRTKTQKMHSGGKRSKFYGDVVGYDGTTNGKLEEELFEKPSKSKSRTNVGNNRIDFDKIDEDTAVIDADYQNVYKTVPPRDARQLGLAKRNKSSKRLSGGNVTEDFFAFKGEAPSKFRKAPSKDARDLGLPKHSISKREEPGDMKAISERKRNTISEINDIAKPSTKRKPSLVKSRDLVGEAFDGLVDVGKNVGKIGKTVAKAGVAGIGAGFQAIDKGATAFGNSTIGKNIKAQADADYRHMRSHGFRAAESIKGTARNKREISAGSLVTQKGHSRKSSSSSSGSSSSSSRESIHGFYARYIKGHRGHISLQWFYKLQPVEFSDVKGHLSNNEINHLRKAANEVFKGHINIGSISGSSSSSKDSVPTLTQKSGYGLAKGTKTATVGGLIKKRNRSVSQDTDYGNYGYENYGYEPAGTVAGVNRNAGSLVTTKTRAGGLNTLKTHSDIVGSTKTATPEGLFSSNKGGVKAQTNEISTSGINKPTSGGVQAQTNKASPSRLFGKKRGGIRAKKRPATLSKLLSKAGDADRTVTAGVIRRSGEIGTTGSENGIVSKSKPVTTGTIVTKKRTGGASA